MSTCTRRCAAHPIARSYQTRHLAWPRKPSNRTPNDKNHSFRALLENDAKRSATRHERGRASSKSSDSLPGDDNAGNREVSEGTIGHRYEITSCEHP